MESGPRTGMTFSELDAQVVATGLCTKCGGCVSFCSAGEFNALAVGENGYPRYVDEEPCLSDGLCYLICPVTDELDAELREKFGWEPPIGSYRGIRSARSTSDLVRARATDGGVVTALLLYLLDRHLIDGAVVARGTSAGREPLVATTREEIIAAAGSGFGSPPQLEIFGYSYSTYSPTISAVKALTGRHLRTAVVGTPCQIKSIRKMQQLGILPSHLIHYTLGLFCYENFDFEAERLAVLKQKLGIDFRDVVTLNIKEDVIFGLRDGETRHIPFEQMDELARPACLACTEFANDYADISAGGLGSPSGHTTVLLRTEKGSQAYAGALLQGYIEENQIARGVTAAQQEESMVGAVMSFAKRKRARGEGHRASQA